MKLNKQEKQIIEEGFKRLLKDKDKMKYLAYSTMMFPVVQKIINDELKKLKNELLIEKKSHLTDLDDCKQYIWVKATQKRLKKEIKELEK